MRYESGQLTFSPSDLIHFMQSDFITWMDRYYLEYPDKVTPSDDDDSLAILQKKGIEHEKVFLQSLLEGKRDVVTISSGKDAEPFTLQAMKDGREIIYQAKVRQEQFGGYADFLVRVPGKSNLGDYHYEPWDTKLALKPKPYYLIQLCCYAEMLYAIQGILPATVTVVLGSRETRPFRTQDYFYYYKQLKESFLTQQNEFDAAAQPMPDGLDDYGQWDGLARQILEEKDHFSRVANIRKSQIRKLEKVGITTLHQLAETDLSHVQDMHPSTFETLKNQARIQVESIGTAQPKFEIVYPPQGNLRRGLAILPPASAKDVWFDMEGYPHIQGGLEYLFGATYVDANGVDATAQPRFIDWWAHDRDQERKAFESFIDWVYARWREDGTMHIYHYAAYEVSAMRKLMGRYGTREEEVDNLLRNEVFVDLYRVVQQGLRVGEPRYSLKNIEHLYMAKREGDVAKATDSIVYYERWLEQQDGADYTSSKILQDIREYNKIDCDSTMLLTNWLRERQEEAGIAFMPKLKVTDNESETDASPNRPASILAQKLLSRVSEERAAQSSSEEDQKLTELLAYLLEFHRRENKSVWWSMFDRHAMTEDQLIDDLDCLGGLQRTSSPSVAKARSRLLEYSFDAAQDTKLAGGKKCYFAHDLNTSVTIEEIDLKVGKVILRFGPSVSGEPQRLSLIPDEYVNPKIIEESILRQVEAWYQGKPLSGAIEDFLQRRRPKLKGNSSGPILTGAGTQIDQVTEAIKAMAGTTICIQGPPGTGKTHTAANAIAALLNEGKVVGISSNSHKAIAHLLDQVLKVEELSHVRLKAAKIQSKKEDFHVTSNVVRRLEKIADAFGPAGASCNLIGGTAWAFSNEASRNKLDYLFVDEAGQVSIANLLGMAASTENIVLMGDQMQLSQPIKGAHPAESGLSCLDYLLQGRQTIPDDFGIFLGTTFRMHPAICEFVSESVYEGRLHSDKRTESHVLRIPASQRVLITKNAGILFHPVEHDGNTQSSAEEVEAIARLIDELQCCSLAGCDGKESRTVELDDILIVAPYNMQVRALLTKLPTARVGTVDKFQGQEAPIVIVSMCSSDGGDSARGLEFLLSKNRMNVAISRAQALAIVVGSPALASTQCRTVEQMGVVNLFCRIYAMPKIDRRCGKLLKNE